MTGERRAPPRLPLGNMRFAVEIEGVPGTGALEVIFPEARLLGQPRKAGAVQYGRLILKRGLTPSPDWYDWWDAARRGKRPLKKTVRVTVLDTAGAEATGWLFRDATPVAYQLSPLHALGNEPMIESLELSVGDFAAQRRVRAATSGARSSPRRGAARRGT